MHFQKRGFFKKAVVKRRAQGHCIKHLRDTVLLILIKITVFELLFVVVICEGHYDKPDEYIHHEECDGNDVDHEEKRSHYAVVNLRSAPHFCRIDRIVLKKKW